MTTLTKLIELQAAATPGPWEAFTDSYAPTRVLNHKKTICHVIGDSAETDDTAAYIAAARNFDFAALDEKIKRYEAALRFYADGKNYGAVPVCCGNGNIHGCCGNYQPDYEIMNDVGNRAKQALEGTE